MSVRFALFAALIVGSSSANANYSSSVDKDGCWDARDARETKCLKQTDHSWNKGKITVTYRNTCAERIYAKVCQRQNNGNSDCGAFGISGNTDRKYYTYNATGDINYNAVGSTDPSYDWVCKNRWNMRVKG